MMDKKFENGKCFHIYRCKKWVFYLGTDYPEACTRVINEFFEQNEDNSFPLLNTEGASYYREIRLIDVSVNAEFRLVRLVPDNNLNTNMEINRVVQGTLKQFGYAIATEIYKQEEQKLSKALSTVSKRFCLNDVI